MVVTNGVKVALEGNKRKGEMSNDELEQCIHDISSWFNRKKGLNKVKTVTKKEVKDTLENIFDVEIPESLCILLSKQNGGFWFHEYKCLSLEEIISTEKTCGKSWKNWKNKEYIPICADPDGDLLVIYNTNIYDYTQENGMQEDPISNSLSSYLESFRDILLSGKFEFVDEVGVVGKSRK